MQLARLELYKLVCNRPLSKVAPELGISGTALAAICKQYQVPYPGSGYWTRKSLGLAADLLALPEAPDETIEITPSIPKRRPRRTPEEIAARKTRRVAKPDRPAHHPLLFGVEEHFRKTRDVKDGEFLRPYKRILPDLISSVTALPRALSIANDLYLTLYKQGYRVHIAQAADDFGRIHVKEQEAERKDRKYGRYHSGSIWAPDRPTVFYIDSVPIGLAITEMTERVLMRYLNGEYHPRGQQAHKISQTLATDAFLDDRAGYAVGTFSGDCLFPEKRRRLVRQLARDGSEGACHVDPEDRRDFESGEGQFATPHGRRGSG